MIMMIVLIGVVVIIIRVIDNGPAARHGLAMTTVLCWWGDAMGWQRYFFRRYDSCLMKHSENGIGMSLGCHWDVIGTVEAQ